MAFGDEWNDWMTERKTIVLYLFSHPASTNGHDPQSRLLKHLWRNHAPEMTRIGLCATWIKSSSLFFLLSIAADTYCVHQRHGATTTTTTIGKLSTPTKAHPYHSIVQVQSAISSSIVNDIISVFHINWWFWCEWLFGLTWFGRTWCQGPTNAEPNWPIRILKIWKSP